MQRYPGPDLWKLKLLSHWEKWSFTAVIKVTDLESGDYFGFFWIGPKGEPFLGVVPGLDHGNDPRIISCRSFERA